MKAARYTKPAMGLHWIIAVLMIFMLFFGEGLIRVPAGASLAGWRPSAHASIGILILLLALARLSWRIGHRPPELPASVPPWQVRTSHVVHWTLYVLMMAIPLTGLLAIVPYGAEHLDAGRVTFFNLFPVAVLPNLGDWTGHAHVILSKLTQALVILHVAAALKHQFWDKDRLLERMLP
jgi:cytochrome b561